jgi:hypothetical protein
VQDDIQSLMDNKNLIASDVCVIVPVFHDSPTGGVPQVRDVEPLVIRLPGPVSYASTKAIPYKYDATMIENGVEVPLVSPATVDNVVGEITALRSGKVRPPLFQKKVVTPIATIIPPVAPPVDKNAGPSGQSIEESNLDEILRLIKKSDYKIVDQLLQTSSKISILSLLLSSEAHRKVLIKVLEHAYVDHEVSVDQFDGIVGNITACNNLGFGDDELPEAGKHHNLVLHISVHCKSDMISNVLVDTGSSLNVMPESTLRQLSHHGLSLRGSSYLVKAFDGSRKDVLGEVDLPITIGPETFQITFQVMDINASYSCLLGRPWIHDAWEVTSTLHQKLKFVRNGSAEGTSFQGLAVEGAEPRRASASMASLKDAQKAVQEGQAAG